MNILIASDWYPSEKNPVNGIFVQEYAKAIKLFNNVKVLIHPEERDNLNKWYDIKESEENGINVIRTYYRKTKFRPVNSFLNYYTVFIAVKRLICNNWKPDVIHCNVFSSAFAFLPVRLFYKIPIVVSEHWSSIVTGKFRKKRYKFLIKIVFRFVDMVLPVSKFLCNKINEYINIENKCKVVYNTINPIFFDVKKSNRHKIKKSIITVGGLTEIKGYKELIDGIKILSKKRDDFKLTIVGKGPLRKFLEERIKNLKLTKYIKLYGTATKKELSRLFQKSDLFISTSYVETFGVSIAEAMSVGVPVVVTKCGGPEDFVKSFCGKIIPDNKPERIAQSLDNMLDNLERYNPEKIRKYMYKNFSYEAIGKEFDKIYKKVRRKK